MGLTIQQVSQAGELLVAIEINLRGAYAAQFSGNMPGIDLVAIDVPRTRLVGIQVKTRTSGQGWQINTRRGRARVPTPNETVYWVFVDLKTHPAEFYVAPEWWVENAIHERNEWYLARHGGTRPVTPDSTHGLLVDSVLAEWKDRWDVLGIFPAVTESVEVPVAT
jgi:hypothetical protein